MSRIRDKNRPKHTTSRFYLTPNEDEDKSQKLSETGISGRYGHCNMLAYIKVIYGRRLHFHHPEVSSDFVHVSHAGISQNSFNKYCSLHTVRGLIVCLHVSLCEHHTLLSYLELLCNPSSCF